jgi:hypothetical protein
MGDITNFEIGKIVGTRLDGASMALLGVSRATVYKEMSA